MSYTVSGRVNSADEVTEALTKATTTARNNLDKDAEKQLDAACEAAEGLINSGTLGEAPFVVNISGHANPDFKDRTGWPNESVSVSVSRVNERY